MILTRLHVRNFRCHEDLVVDGLDRLAVLVGENDVGKTVLLDAICLALGARSCQERDYREDDQGTQAANMSLEAEFRLEDHDDLPDRFRSGEDRSRLLFGRSFLAGGRENLWVEGIGHSDARFDDENFGVAETQKVALRDFGVSPARTKEERYPQREQLIASGKLTFVPRKLEASIRDLAPYLPRLERISSTEFADPASVVLRTLQAVARGIVEPLDPETQVREEREELQALRRDIEAALNEQINSALEILRGVHRSLATLRVAPRIDFSNVVRSVDLVVDTASGNRSLSMHGAGTNRRIWMGLLQWEREVARQRGGESGSVLRLYDEPDVNLHPGAQRDLFATISGWANDTEAHTQCIVCTHAITMIDRAPLTAVRLLQTDEAGRRSVDRITAGGGEAQVRLLNEIGRAIGLSNSALLYERAFLVFEGPSEQAALPLLYRTLFSRTVAEDGIVLVNLDGCGGWKSVLDVLFRNRLQLVHLVLDEDCRGGDAGDRISLHDLDELGCRPDFLEQQITFVGQKEFEDSFSDHLIVRALQAELPREDGRHWQETDLQPAREGSKFSHELTRIAVAGCAREKKNVARKKPEIAAAIARHCAGDEIPAAIVSALTSIRQRAGLA